MDSMRIMHGYDYRLKREGILKSLLAGMTVGLAVAFVTAFITWMTGFNAFWLPIVLFAVCVAAFTVLFYVKKFRPAKMTVARRLDELGLEERMITMAELENDDSDMAVMQRADAVEKLRTFDAARLRIRVPVKAIIISSAAVLLGAGMTVVTTLSAFNVIPYGSTVFTEVIPQVMLAEYSVVYQSSEGGYIIGETEQKVKEGESSSSVVATAELGWRFERWSDGQTDPSRSDTDVDSEITVTAQFVQVQEYIPQEEDPDEPEDVPYEDAAPGQPGGGVYVDNNQIIDGETPYLENFEDYYNYVMELISSGKEFTPEQLEMIEAYFNSLR